MSDRMTGTVVTIIRAKGFAFIRGEDGMSRFAHARDFVDQREFDLLSDGKSVSFIPMDLNKSGQMIRGNGLRAVDVRIHTNDLRGI
jgi:cold shock CspA family protein